MTKRSGLAAGVLLAVIAGVATAQAASPYGCFQVTAPELNIRDRPYRDAAVIGTAIKGDVLEKRKRWCTLRGYWCAVRKGGLNGYADKAFMAKIPCP
jgi:hypothetical protein